MVKRSWRRKCQLLVLPVVLALQLIAPPLATSAGPKCFGKTATIVGTSGNDNDNQAPAIRGTSGDDVIHSGAGHDLVFGRGGDDLICTGSGIGDGVRAGPGNDRVHLGSDGGDYIYGEGGNDTGFAGPGDSQLQGNGGDDVLRSGSGFQYLKGGAGNDVLYGGSGRDLGDGGPGTDTCKKIEQKSNCEK